MPKNKMSNTEFVIIKGLFCIVIPALILVILYLIASFVLGALVPMNHDAWVITRLLYAILFIVFLFTLERD